MKNPWIVIIAILPQFPEMYRAAAELGLNVLSITDEVFDVPAKIAPQKIVYTRNWTAANIKKIVKRQLGKTKPLAYFTVREEELIAISKLNHEIKNKNINPHRIVEMCRDKHAVRQALKNTPFTIDTALADLKKPKDPFPGFKKIVKPMSDASGIGVIQVEKDDNFAQAVKKSYAAYNKNMKQKDYCSAATKQKSARYILVEKFIEGQKYIAELFVHKGKARCLSVVSRGDMTPPYFKETYNYAPAKLPAKTYGDIAKKACAAAKALGITHGGVHMETAYDAAGKFTVIEVNLRTGGSGWLHKLVHGSTGIDYIKAILAQIAGKNPLPYLRENKKDISLLALIPADGKGRAAKLPDHTKMPAKPADYRLKFKLGDFCLPYPQTGDYRGYYIFNVKGRGPKAYAKIDKLIAQAAKHLRYKYLIK